MSVTILQKIKDVFCKRYKNTTIFPADQNQKVAPEPIDTRNWLQKFIDWDEEICQKNIEMQRNRRLRRTKQKLKEVTKLDISEEEFDIQIERILDYAYDIYDDDILFEEIYKEYEIIMSDLDFQTQLIPPILNDDIPIEEINILSDDETSVSSTSSIYNV
jgi:hypothetical protein